MTPIHEPGLSGGGSRRPPAGGSTPGRFSLRKPAKARPKPNLAVQSHHRHAAHKPTIEPAPDCFPEAARTPVTVHVKGWNNAISGHLVRVDAATKQILVALPEHTTGRHGANRGDQALVGWPDHDVWHESRSAVSAKIQTSARYVWLHMTTVPVHHERRRFVRAKHVRPVAIHKGNARVQATSMDLSEAAMRLVMGTGEAVHKGDDVHLIFNTPDRHKGSAVTMTLDGHVYRSQELKEGQAGRKEVVIFFENLTPAQQDSIRSIVFDLHLQDRKPAVLD